MHSYIPHLLSDISAAYRTDIQEEEFPQTNLPGKQVLLIISLHIR